MGKHVNKGILPKKSPNGNWTYEKGAQLVSQQENTNLNYNVDWL